MITEDRVTFEIAKLLRDKGFDEPCDFIYDEDNLKWVYHAFIFLSDGGLATNSKLKDMRGEIVTAPTVQMALKWLRGMHDLHICIFIVEDYSTDADGNTVDKWQFWTYNITNIWGDMVYDAYDKFDCNEYQSYEETCEAAIKYCLENLI